MARITFPIFRLGFLKNLGGVIDEACRRGHQVNLLYDINSTNSHKGILAPNGSNFPKFKYGQPELVSYNGITNFSETVSKISDILVVHQGLPIDFLYKNYPIIDQYLFIKKSSIPIVSLMSHFYDNCLLPLEAYEFFDKSCLLSPYSYYAHKQLLIQLSSLSKFPEKYDESRIDHVFTNRIQVTGSALFDIFNQIYQKRTIGNNKDMILFVPKIDSHPYMKIIINNHNRLTSIIHSLLRYKGRYASEILRVPRFKQFLKTLNAFAKSQNLNIVSKSRPKHGKQYQNLLKKISKNYLTGDDDNFYPNFTTSEIFKKAVLSIHMRTFSVMEAVISGTPAINLEIPIFEDIDIKNSWQWQTRYYVKLVRSSKPDSIFNFSGCVWNVKWKDAIKFFNNISLEELRQCSDRRKEYCSYFCGITDEPAAHRQMNVIEKIV